MSRDFFSRLSLVNQLQPSLPGNAGNQVRPFGKPAKQLFGVVLRALTKSTANLEPIALVGESVSWHNKNRNVAGFSHFRLGVDSDAPCSRGWDCLLQQLFHACG